jgi:hypothetical protein
VKLKRVYKDIRGRELYIGRPAQFCLEHPCDEFQKDLAQKILSDTPVLLRVTGYPFYAVQHLAHTALTELVAQLNLSNHELSEVLGIGQDLVERALRSPVDPRHRQLSEKHHRLLRDLIKSKSPI